MSTDQKQPDTINATPTIDVSNNENAQQERATDDHLKESTLHTKSGRSAVNQSQEEHSRSDLPDLPGQDFVLGQSVALEDTNAATALLDSKELDVVFDTRNSTENNKPETVSNEQRKTVPISVIENQREKQSEGTQHISNDMDVTTAKISVLHQSAEQRTFSVAKNVYRHNDTQRVMRDGMQNVDLAASMLAANAQIKPANTQSATAINFNNLYRSNQVEQPMSTKNIHVTLKDSTTVDNNATNPAVKYSKKNHRQMPINSMQVLSSQGIDESRTANRGYSPSKIIGGVNYEVYDSSSAGTGSQATHMNARIPAMDGLRLIEMNEQYGQQSTMLLPNVQQTNYPVNQVITMPSGGKVSPDRYDQHIQPRYTMGTNITSAEGNSYFGTGRPSGNVMQPMMVQGENVASKQRNMMQGHNRGDVSPEKMQQIMNVIDQHSMVYMNQGRSLSNANRFNLPIMGFESAQFAQHVYDQGSQTSIDQMASGRLSKEEAGATNAVPISQAQEQSWTERALRNAGIKRDKSGNIIAGTKDRKPLYKAAKRTQGTSLTRASDLSRLLPSLPKQPHGIAISYGGSTQESRNMSLKPAASHAVLRNTSYLFHQMKQRNGALQMEQWQQQPPKSMRRMMPRRAYGRNHHLEAISRTHESSDRPSALQTREGPGTQSQGQLPRLQKQEMRQGTHSVMKPHKIPLLKRAKEDEEGIGYLTQYLKPGNTADDKAGASHTGGFVGDRSTSNLSYTSDVRYHEEGHVTDLKCLHDSQEKKKRLKELAKVTQKRIKETATMQEKELQQELADALISSSYILEGNLQYSPYTQIDQGLAVAGAHIIQAKLQEQKQRIQQRQLQGSEERLKGAETSRSNLNTYSMADQDQVDDQEEGINLHQLKSLVTEVLNHEEMIEDIRNRGMLQVRNPLERHYDIMDHRTKFQIACDESQEMQELLRAEHEVRGCQEDWMSHVVEEMGDIAAEDTRTVSLNSQNSKRKESEPSKRLQKDSQGRIVMRDFMSQKLENQLIKDLESDKQKGRFSEDLVGGKMSQMRNERQAKELADRDKAIADRLLDRDINKFIDKMRAKVRQDRENRQKMKSFVGRQHGSPDTIRGGPYATGELNGYNNIGSRSASVLDHHTNSFGKNERHVHINEQDFSTADEAYNKAAAADTDDKMSRMDQAMMSDFKKTTVGRKNEQLMRDYGISFGSKKKSQTHYNSKMGSTAKMQKIMTQSTSQQSLSTVNFQETMSLPQLDHGKNDRKLYDSELLHLQKLDSLQAKFEQLVTKQKSTLNEEDKIQVAKVRFITQSQAKQMRDTSIGEPIFGKKLSRTEEVEEAPDSVEDRAHIRNYMSQNIQMTQSQNLEPSYRSEEARQTNSMMSGTQINENIAVNLNNLDNKSNDHKVANLLDVDKDVHTKSVTDALTPKPASDSLKFSQMSTKAADALKRVQKVVHSKKFDMVSYLMKRFDAMRVEFERTTQKTQIHLSSVDSSGDGVSGALPKPPAEQESERFEVSSEDMPEDISTNESVAGKARYVPGESNQSKRRPTYSPDKIIAARLNKIDAYKERATLQDQLINNRAMRKFFNDHEERILSTFASLVGEHDDPYPTSNKNKHAAKANAKSGQKSDRAQHTSARHGSPERQKVTVREMYMRYLFEQYAEDDMEIVRRFETEPKIDSFNLETKKCNKKKFQQDHIDLAHLDEWLVERLPHLSEMKRAECARLIKEKQRMRAYLFRRLGFIGEQSGDYMRLKLKTDMLEKQRKNAQAIQQEMMMGHQSSLHYSQHGLSGQDDVASAGIRADRSKGNTPRFENASPRSHLDASEGTAQRLNMKLFQMAESVQLTPANGPGPYHRETPIKSTNQKTVANLASGWQVKHDKRLHNDEERKKKEEQDKKFEYDMKITATQCFGTKWYLKPDDFKRSMLGYQDKLLTKMFEEQEQLREHDLQAKSQFMLENAKLL